MIYHETSVKIYLKSYKPETLKSVETKVKNQMPTSEELLGDKLKTERNLTRNDVRNIVRRNSIVNEVNFITNFFIRADFI